MADKADKSVESEKIKYRYLVGAIVIVVTLWIFTFSSFIWGDKFSFIAVGDRGTFGDMFGGLNALFSGLAFAGIIFTIYMQRKELALQREELKLTRNTLESQRMEMEFQNETLKVQQFENTFFSMMRAFNNIINSIDMTVEPRSTRAFRKVLGMTVEPPPKKYTISGRDCIRHVLVEFMQNSINSTRNIEDIEWDRIIDRYLEIYHNHQSDLGHYFRYLYNIVKFVDQSEIADKKFYTNLVRAQLSFQELALLFYNCLSENGRERFKPLIEEYALLKHVPDSFLLHASHREYYEPSAYGEVE